MKRASDESVAHATLSRIRRGGRDRLWTYADFPDVGRMALAAALSRLVKAGELTRVRRGVYYRPKATVFGPSRPDPEALVDAALRARGEEAVASGVGAYSRLGFTTQVSGAVTRATRRRVPKNFVGKAIPGLAVHARPRPFGAQPGIRPEERTAFDALRDIGRIPDAHPADVLRRLRMLVASGRLRFARLARFAAAEPPRVRALLGAIGEDLRASGSRARVPRSALHGLRASLNPLTTYAVPGVRGVLAGAASWRLERRSPDPALRGHRQSPNHPVVGGGRVPQVIVIGGPNGAGKTSSAPELLRDTIGIAAFVNADLIAEGLSGFRPEDAGVEAGRILLARLRELAGRRADFAFESTLSGRTLHAFLRRLADTGYECHICYLWLSSVDLAVARVRRRVQAGGHDVPEPVIRRRFRKSLINFDRLYRPVATTWRLYDGNAPVGTRLIAHGGAGGQQTVVDAERWKFVRRQIEKESQ